MSYDARIATPNEPTDYAGNDRLPIGRVSADDWSVILLEDALATFTHLSTYAIPVVNGGTGATNATDARTNLGAAASGPIISSNLTVATGKILGRTTASTGAIEEIIVGSGLSLAGGVLSTTDAGGTVTSVDLTVPTSVFNVTGGPITSSGTLDLTFKTQNANTIFAGPTNGAAATPTFRALVAADLPSHTHTSANISDATATGLALLTSVNVAAAQTTLNLVPGTNVQAWDGDLDALAALTGTNVIYYRSAANTWTPVTVSTGLSFSGGTLSSTVTGTVTSVDLSMPGIFSVSGNPVTTSGTLSVALVNQDANKVFAGPTTGLAASPTFRLLVAADIPSHTHVSTEISDSTTAGRVLLTAVDAAAQRTALSLRPGVDIQQWDGDLDSLASATGTNTIYYRSAANTWSPVAIGPGLNFVSGELSITEVGLGTVTSVDVSGGTTGLTFSGGPITTSGTITMAGTLAVANGGTGTTSVAGIKTLLDLAGTNTGDQTITLTGHVTGSGTGSFATTIASNVVADSMLRQSNGLSLVGRSVNSTGDVADITAAADFQVFRREGSSIGFGQIRLNSSAAVTGVLASANGGTGAASYADGDILYGSSASGLQKLTGNTTTTRKYLSQLGTGTTGSAPNWNVLATTDMPAFTGGDVTSSAGSAVLSIGTGAVTLGKMANLPATAIIGNNTTVTAPPVAMTPSAPDQILRNSGAGTAIAWGSIDLSKSNAVGVSVLSVTNGGSGQGTALNARGPFGLNIESGTGRGDSNYTIVAADRFVYTNATFTAARTFTLPAANAVNGGASVIVADLQGTVTNTNTLSIARAGSDTINGGTANFVMTSPRTMFRFTSDGTSKWFAEVVQSRMQAKAWVRFTISGGVVTVQASHNVSSVTRSSAGVYLVNFVTAFASATYAPIASGGNVSGVGNLVYDVVIISASQCQISSAIPSSQALNEASSVNFFAFGD